MLSVKEFFLQVFIFSFLRPSSVREHIFRELIGEAFLVIGVALRADGRGGGLKLRQGDVRELL